MADPNTASNAGPTDALPVRPSRFMPVSRPVQAFLSAESSGGIVLLIAAVVALAWSNSPWGDSYGHFWHARVSLGFGPAVHAMSLEHWVNDGLMVVFFLLVGLEIKRELLLGELATVRRAALPVAAALGGMIVPALVYAAFNSTGPGSAGWGIPMATDIAFAVGVLALVGRGVPTSVKVFLLAIAIVDDLGAILVIAVFYTGAVSLTALAVGGGFLGALVLLNVCRVHRPLPYVVLGFGLWAATLTSGIHATIAGVLLAFTIPAKRRVDVGPQAEQSLLVRGEHALLRPVNFLIVPLFALANAGVDLRGGLGDGLTDRVTWGVFLGLLVGKPVGILLASWLATSTGLAALPAGATRQQVVGIAVLCGIGFTMSLFVANLAFPGDAAHLADSKVGILAASLASGLAGACLMTLSRRRAVS